MRAEYLESILGKTFKKGEQLSLIKDDFHHLVKVARVEEGERIILLDGSGRKLECIVDKIEGKTLQLIVERETRDFRIQRFELAFCLPKKSATDEIVKVSAEIGLAKVHMLFSDYSWKVPPRSDRIKQLVISAMKQSNYSIMTEFPTAVELRSFPFQEFNRVYFFSLNEGRAPEVQIKPNEAKREIFLIGPEGGFSPSEEKFLLELPNIFPIHLQTPILRAQTAVTVAYGYLLGLEAAQSIRE